MPQSRPSKSRADVALDATQDAVRASIEAASKVAQTSMEAGTEAARKVQESLKTALEALTARDGKSHSTPSRKSA
jgi:hypothetical protein